MPLAALAGMEMGAGVVSAGGGGVVVVGRDREAGIDGRHHQWECIT